MATEVIAEVRDNSNQQLVNAGDSTNTAIRVNIVAGGGTSSGGGGVQYPVGTAVATATGNVILGVATSGTLLAPTATPFANSTALAVEIVDASGNQITSFGGGTTTVVQGTATNFNANVSAYGVVDVNNSSTNTLAANGSFVGTGVDLLPYVSIDVAVFADQNSTVNGLQIQYSQDNSNWNDTEQKTSYIANTPVHFFLDRQSRYYRVLFTNTNTGQTVFRLQSILQPAVALVHTELTGNALDDTDSAVITKGVIYGKTTGTGGGYIQVKVNPSGAINVDGTSSQGGIWTTTVTQGTASNLNATIVGTVGVTQVTSPWVVSGTTTIIPSGTQTVTLAGTETVVGTVTTVPSGTTTTTGTVNFSGSSTATLSGIDTYVQAVGGGTSGLTQALAVADKELYRVVNNLADEVAKLNDNFVNNDRPKVRPIGKCTPRLISAGQYNEFRLGPTSALITQDAHGKYYEAVRQGNVFTAFQVAGVASAAGTNLAGLILYNPMNSDKNLSLLYMSSIPALGTTTASLGASSFYIATNIKQSSITGTNTGNITITNNLIGGPLNPVAITYSTATIPVAPTVMFQPIAMFQVGTSGMTQWNGGIFFDGLFCIAPGNLTLLITPAVGYESMIWEEIPIR